ncbi:MAG: hypothetical protein ACRBK7_02840 [Acidimicrobiales bacterium]
MAAAFVDGTLVAEVGEGLVRVRVDSPNVSELAPGTAIELTLSGDPRQYLGTILTMGGEGDITVLLDLGAITEQVASVENVDDALGGLPDDVPPIQGMVR